MAGARVLLREVTSEQAPAIGLTTVSTASMDDGTYSLTGVPPGKYKIVAVDRADTAAIHLGLTEDLDAIAESIEIGDRETVKKDLKREAAAHP